MAGQQGERTSKEIMISEILIAAKASGVYVSGDMFFALAFRTETELRQICREIGIRATK